MVTLKRLILAVVLFAIFPCRAAEVNDVSKFTHTSSPTGFIKGHSWGWTGTRGEYMGEAPSESMKKLAQTGANWVCISFAGQMNEPNNPNDTRIYWAENCPNMVTDNEVRRSIELARQNKLKVILKPVVNVRDGTWRGYIDYRTEEGKTDEQAWDRWWADYKGFLLHYAKIAEQTKCEMYCLGCEMGTTEPFVEKWRDVIADVRKVYSGAITYNANHGNEAKVRWWDEVDIIGMSGYYPVGTAMKDLTKVPPSDNSIDAMKQRWAPVMKRLKYISRRFDKPLFFIEIGVCSARGNSAAPWTHPNKDTPYYAEEQVRFYQAVMEIFWDEPWFFGFVWWDWPAHLYPEEKGKTDNGFCIYGKPAEKLVMEWFAKPR